MKRISSFIIIAGLIATISCFTSCSFWNYDTFSSADKITTLDGSLVDATIEITIPVACEGTEIKSFNSVTLNRMFTTEIEEFKAVLTSPSGTSKVLFSWEGAYYTMDGNYTFEGHQTAYSEEDTVPPLVTDWNKDYTRDDTDGGIYQAEEDIYDFAGENPNGDWILTISEASNNYTYDFEVGIVQIDIAY